MEVLAVNMVMVMVMKLIVAPFHACFNSVGVRHHSADALAWTLVSRAPGRWKYYVLYFSLAIIWPGEAKQTERQSSTSR